MKRLLALSLLLKSVFALAAEPFKVMQLEFAQSVRPEIKDLQVGRTWDCQEVSTTSAYRGLTSIEFSLFGETISGFYSSPGSETLIYEPTSGSLRAVMPDTFGDPACEHYVRIHPDGYLVAETVCFRVQGPPAIADPAHTAADYEVCKIRGGM